MIFSSFLFFLFYVYLKCNTIYVNGNANKIVVVVVDHDDHDDEDDDQLQYGLALDAGSSVVGTGCSLSPSCCQSCNVGPGRFGLGLSQDFQTNATKLARLVNCCRNASIGGI